MRGWLGYSGHLIETLFRLQEYDRVREVAARARDLYPDQPVIAHWGQAIALAARSSIGRLNDVLDTLYTEVRPTGGDTYRLASLARETFVRVGEILAAIGDTAAAREVLERAVTHFETRQPRESEMQQSGLWYGWALNLLGRHEESQTVFNALVDDYPDDIPARGRRAVVAVIRGDTLMALHEANLFAELRQPFLRGEHTYWRAVIAAWLGDRVEATALLRQAYEQGRVYSWYDNVSAELGPLRSYPPFEEWLRPKG